MKTDIGKLSSRKLKDVEQPFYIRSRVLGETIVVVPDKWKLKTRPLKRKAPVYRVKEVLALIKCAKVDLKMVHALKKMFHGKIMEVWRPKDYEESRAHFLLQVKILSPRQQREADAQRRKARAAVKVEADPDSMSRIGDLFSKENVARWKNREEEKHGYKLRNRH